jgi:hypothetical protein
MNSRFASPILAVLSLSLAACEKGKPVVILDAWWSEDYAEEACSHDKRLGRENSACATDVRGVVRDFETELQTELATDERSNAFTFLVYYGPEHTSGSTLRAMAKATARPHWMLGIDFVPGRAKQSWWLNSPAGQHLGGEGDAKEIAQKTCESEIQCSCWPTHPHSLGRCRPQSTSM